MGEKNEFKMTLDGLLLFFAGYGADIRFFSLSLQG